MSNEDPQIGYALKHAQSLLNSRMEEALRPLGLTVSHYSCLFRLRVEPGISASALARRTVVTRQSMNAMLQQLLERHLVTRPDQPETGRALPVELTAEGGRILDAAQLVVDAVERRMLASLTPVEAATLSGQLATVIRALAD